MKPSTIRSQIARWDLRSRTLDGPPITLHAHPDMRRRTATQVAHWQRMSELHDAIQARRAVRRAK